MANFTDPLSYKDNWNQYGGDFDNRKEIEFYDEQMYEYAAIKGVPIEYCTINVDDYKEGIDVIYGENSRPKWDKKYKIVAILEDFTQELRQFGNIPIQNIDEAQMFIHRSMFDQIIGIRTAKATVKNSERRGAFGPIAGDQIITIHNGLIYEVVEGGLHFLSSEAQHFGHKFWYKVSLKSREVSDATVGEGEQYGGTPDLKIPDQYKGNPQYLLNSPTKEELYTNSGTPTPITVITTGSTGTCNNVEYVTTGSASGPVSVPPSDLIDQSGNTKSEYIVPGLQEGSLFKDNVEIKKEEDAIIDPDTDHKVDPTSDAGLLYGPTGRVISHTRKDLFKDWE